VPRPEFGTAPVAAGFTWTTAEAAQAAIAALGGKEVRGRLFFFAPAGCPGKSQQRYSSNRYGFYHNK